MLCDLLTANHCFVAKNNTLTYLSIRSCLTYGSSNTWGKLYLWPLRARGACCHPQVPETSKVPSLSQILFSSSSYSSMWFCDFLTSCMCQHKITRVWRRVLIAAIPYSGKALGPQRVITLYQLCVPFKFLSDSSTLVSNLSSTHYSRWNMWAFDTEGHP